MPCHLAILHLVSSKIAPRLSQYNTLGGIALDLPLIAGGGEASQPLTDMLLISTILCIETQNLAELVV
jgi:hypothetical protein